MTSTIQFTTSRRLHARNLSRGFTLIELLVVIAIISILAGIAVFGVMSAIQSAKVTRVQTMIQQLRAALESYETDNGYYPPSELMWYDLTLADPNYENTGIETALIALRSESGAGGAYFDFEAYSSLVGNTDQDDLPEAYTFFGIDSTKIDLFELVDAWGNPLVYVSEDYYEDPNFIPFMVTLFDGSYVDITPQRITDTGTFPRGFMIWSFGPNGINENGDGDDIVSWDKKR